MSKLIELYEKLSANYKEYAADNSKLELLTNNIHLFEKIKNETLAQTLKSGSLSDLQICNEILFIAGKSYTAYAFAHQNESSAKYLTKANKCYALVSTYVRKLPPFSLSLELGKQNTEAIYYQHKAKFDQAKTELFFIKKQLKGHSIDLNLMEKSLLNVIKIYEEFQSIVIEDYRDPALKKQLSINDQSIKEEIAEAKELLSNVRKRAKKRPDTEQHSTSPTTQNSAPPEILSATISQEEEEEPHFVRPKGKKIKRIILEDNDELMNSVDNPSSLITNPHQELPNTQEKAEPATESASISTTGVSDLSDLVILSETAFSSRNLFFTQLPVHSTTTNPINRSSLTTQTSTITSFNTLWKSLPTSTYSEDSRNCWKLLKEWRDAYFREYTKSSDNAKKTLALEKLGHMMLLAAARLQKESKVFGGTAKNPAIRLAVQLFLKTAESKSAEVSTKYLNPIAHSRSLSARYSELLTLFTEKKLEKTKYIEELRKQFSKEDNLITLLGLSIEETVNTLFKTLAEVCTAEDYEKIKDTCITSLHSTHQTLNTESHLKF